MSFEYKLRISHFPLLKDAQLYFQISIHFRRRQKSKYLYNKDGKRLGNSNQVLKIIYLLEPSQLRLTEEGGYFNSKEGAKRYISCLFLFYYFHSFFFF